jgi:hypothetical protein
LQQARFMVEDKGKLAACTREALQGLVAERQQQRE